MHQLLREYHLLGGILETFVSEETVRLGLTNPAAPTSFSVAARISHALRVLQQTTIDTFISEYTDRIAAQHARLESFNRLVSHELRQPLGTLQFSLRTAAHRRSPTTRRNATGCWRWPRPTAQRLIDLTRRLEQVARLQHRTSGANPARQEVDLTALTKEVARQLAEMAESRGVAIRVAEDLPVVVDRRRARSSSC